MTNMEWTLLGGLSVLGYLLALILDELKKQTRILNRMDDELEKIRSGERPTR